jgi:hypothetical protein
MTNRVGLGSIRQIFLSRQANQSQFRKLICAMSQFIYASGMTESNLVEYEIKFLDNVTVKFYMSMHILAVVFEI